MIKPVSVLFALTAPALLGGCASQNPPSAASPQSSGRQCFLASEVNSFSASPNGFVDVKVGASRWFRLELGGGCPNINWSQQIGIRSTGGGSFICEGFDAELIVPDPSGTQHCPVSGIRMLTPAEIQAAIHRK